MLKKNISWIKTRLLKEWGQEANNVSPVGDANRLILDTEEYQLESMGKLAFHDGIKASRIFTGGFSKL